MDSGVIQLEQFIDHPPAKVWEGLTTPEIHSAWWASGDVRPVVGHRFTLDMGHWGLQPCEVLAVEHERLLSYSFAPGTLRTTITWRLTPQVSGTLLALEHGGFGLDSLMGRSAYKGMSAGWPKALARIARVLESESKG